MKRFYKKLKLLFSLLFKKQFIVVYFPAYEEAEWQSFNLEIEQVCDACYQISEDIEDIIQDYIDCEEADRLGDELINFTNLN